MDKSAIEQIQVTASIPELIAQISKSNIDSAVLVPVDFEVRDIEGYMDYRRSYRFNYGTENIEDYIAYCTEFAVDDSHCFVDEKIMTAAAIFDMGSVTEAEHQRHKAHLTLEKSPAYIALLEVCNCHRLSQNDAAEFMEDWGSHGLVQNQDGDSMSVSAAAAAFRDITIESVKQSQSYVGNFSESMSDLEKIEAKNQNAIPATITFMCKPYRGLGRMHFDVKVSIICSGDKPALSLRIIQHEVKKQDMSEEFKELLKEGFKELPMKTYIGRNNSNR